MSGYRPDVNGPEQGLFKKNKRILLRTAEQCALCGGYIDKSLKYPNPMSASVDHVIPVKRGGKSTLDNLQVTHLICNLNKGAKIVTSQQMPVAKKNIPQVFDWSEYGG